VCSSDLTSVVGFGLFVTLDELHVEGLVHVTELGGEYFRFDELRQELRGDRSGMRYGVGTRVRVQVSRVDLDGRRIDFRMVKELAAPARSSSRPRVPPADLREEASSADLLAATLAQDRVVKATARKSRVAASPARKSADRVKGVGKAKTAAPGKRGRR
jgi:ribonuclease R